ncbi:AAA family ATPase (plasmid) [Pseudomonas nitroreducens]|uniref:transposase n=1 Tax=Pseudomonas nitroreducens TaxID=46680 RepID=UPI001F2F1FAB|nr:transposase [Pseudomonas nitroreducens]
MDDLIAAEMLSNALKKIYLPNDFSLSLIKELAAKASLHSEQLFSSEKDYITRIYTPPDVEVAPICLTGLAGVGKTQTISALRKVLPSPTDFECNHFDGKLQLISHWYASARGKAGGRQMLADFVQGSERPGSRNAAKLLIECRRRANRDGVSLLLLEETQHINTGQGVSRVTDILLTLAAIGPPMLYVSNYSLLHKLLGRNSEDKQRLLSEPRIMLPDDPDSLAWKNYIVECARVSGEIIQGPLDDFSEEIYRATCGIKRLAVQLIKQAFLEARSAGRNVVSLSDISRAFRSTAYAANRDDVEELHVQALQNRKTGSRLDLRCPFELPSALKTNIVAFSRADRESRVINKVFDSALTAPERGALAQIESEGPEAASAAKVPRPAPLPKASKDDLASAFHHFVESLDAPPKPKKPK